MAKKIEIYENTLLKLLVRRGIDADRRNVVLSEGELGYTTDLKKLYIGDGQTLGGIPVGGNRTLPSTNDVLTISDVAEGDVIFSPSDGKLYRFLGGVNDSMAKWESIGGVAKSGNSTINVSQDNSITVGLISAGNIDTTALLGDGLTVDSVTGKITLSKNIPIDVINTSTPNGVLEIPGRLKINDLTYSLPVGDRQNNSYLATDVSGNLTWKQLESAATILTTNPSGVVPVGTIVPFVSSANVPPGWLLCDGQSISKVTYSALYSTIGDTYGSDASTFKLPNLLNQTLYGVQDNPGTSTTYGIETNITGTIEATGTLFLIKATPDPIATPTLTVTGPLSCSVDGIPKTGTKISTLTGDIVIGPTPIVPIAGSTGYRNKVINGNFDIWQRREYTLDIPVSGSSFPSSHTADRWVCQARGDGNGTYSVTRQPCTVTELDYFNASSYQRLTYKNGVGGAKVITLNSFVGPDTEINIIGDTSGSMPDAVNTLERAVASGELRAILLPFYNNDPVLYSQKVKFFRSGRHEDGAERTFSANMLNKPRITPGSRVINMVFQDESGGQETSYEHTNNANYVADMTALRTTLGTYAPKTFIGLVFQVTTQWSAPFKTFLQKVKAGTGVFSSLNLADKPEVKFVYDIQNTTTELYYVDVIKNAILSYVEYVDDELTPTYEDMDNYYSSVLAIQNIENAHEVLGKPMTLSFWARASQPTKIFSETQIHSTGTGAFWTPTIHKVFDLSTTWQKYTHTYTMPTYAQVIGAAYNPNDVVVNNPTYTITNIPPLSTWMYQVDIKTHWTKAAAIRHGNAWNGTTSLRPGAAVNFPGEAMTPEELKAVNTSVLSGAEGYYDIAQVQLEEGSEATDFEFRPVGTELGLCQRYYYKTYDIGVLPNTATDDGSIWGHEPVAPGAGGIHCAQGSFAVPMAKKPTIRFYNPRDPSAATGTYGNVYVGGATDGNGTVYNVTRGTKRVSTISVNFADPSPPVSNLYITGYHFTADAEI